MTLTANTINDLASVAAAIAGMVGERRVLAFEGEMGAGKTTLIKELCRQWGVAEEVNSPTFSLVNEYRAAGGTVYHLDLYRLRSIEEALDMGIEEYLDSGALCLIEWPGLIAPLMPPDVMSIQISAEEDETRTITIK